MVKYLQRFKQVYSLVLQIKKEKRSNSEIPEKSAGRIIRAGLLPKIRPAKIWLSPEVARSLESNRIIGRIFGFGPDYPVTPDYPAPNLAGLSGLAKILDKLQNGLLSGAQTDIWPDISVEAGLSGPDFCPKSGQPKFG